MSNRIKYEESAFNTAINDLESVISDFLNDNGELIELCNTMLSNWNGLSQSYIENGMKSIQISLLNQAENIEVLQNELRNSFEKMKLADSDTANIIDRTSLGGR